ncbi:MAG: prkC 14, partial [Planctomycetaceae bacterium]|nr:prkC 14 [Planctomycetaceae bacterium]
MAKFDDLGRKFSDAMCNSFSISFDQAVEACRAVTRQLQELHSQGMLHGRIGAAAIFIATDNSVKLLDRHGSPVPTSKELTGWRPAELSRLPNPDLPAEFDAAQRVLRDAGIKTAPYQVDLYAVGSLLCQFVTHELPSAYLRSPKIKGKVPAHLQAILQRALGSDGDAFYLNAQQLLDALDASWESAETYVPHDAETPIANDGVSVSSESRHSLDPGDRNRLTDFSQSISQPELPFSRLGHYEIQARIGGGGMGDVYRAFEPALDRTVAIKVLPPELAREADFIDRFHAEATAAAKLVHPNVVQIFYIGVEGKHHFFAMQFVPGESLAELLRRRERLEQSVALGIVEQLLAGLGAAHQLGLIHRDIKPGNILLDQHSQRALLADFGLVKSLDSTTTGKTTTGVVMGTVDYISPEQGRGLPVDGRSDLYSLGVLIYQMLSGRLPFEAASATAMIFQHVYDQPPDIRGLVPGIPEPLAGMIDRLLAKDPDQRYPTTAVLLQDLIAFRRGEPLPSDVGHIWATVSSGKTASTNGSGLSGELPDELLASLQPKGWWRPFRDRCRTIFRRHAPEFIAQLQHTQQQLDGAVALYERRVWTLNDDFQQGKLILSELEARLKAAEQLEKTNSDAQTAQLEDLQRHVSDQEQVTRDVELRLANARAQLLKLKNQCDLLQARLLAARARIGQGTKRSVARRLIQTFGIMACIVVVAVLPFLLIPGARESLFLALRPPANKAAAPGASKDGVATPRFRAVRPDLIELNGNPTCVAWSPVPNKVTQGHFAIGFEDGFVREYWLQNENSMREVVEFKVSDDAVTCMRYTSDGQKLAVTAKGNDHLQIWDVNRKQEYRRLNGLSKPSEEIRFSLNDEQVLATDLDGIRIWNVQSGQQVDFLGFSLLRSAANHFDVSRDGRDFLIGASLSGAES